MKWPETRRKAQRTVVLVGAGASAPTGYPVTGQLLSRIWEGLHLDDPSKGWQRWAGMKVAQGGREKRRKLLRFFGEIFPGLGRAKSIDGASIVDVLSLADLLLSEGRAAHAGATHAELREQRALLDIAMNGVLRGSAKPRLYGRLGRWILATAGRSRTSRVAIVTTNYDTLLEDALYRRLRLARIPIARSVDFGLPWRPEPARPPVVQRPQNAPLACLKLHGSLNWLRCENCGYVTITPGERIHSLEFWARRSAKGFNVCECGGLLRGTLVVPSTVRDVRDPNLLGIWQAALEEIRLADRLIILGYSMPSEDITVRSLLLRALNGRPLDGPNARVDKPLDVEVVQFEPDEHSTSALPRFQMMFPKGQLPADRYHRGGFEAWLNSSVAEPADRVLAAALRTISARARD